jgi:hypothetical protein
MDKHTPSNVGHLRQGNSRIRCRFLVLVRRIFYKHISVAQPETASYNLDIDDLT